MTTEVPALVTSADNARETVEITANRAKLCDDVLHVIAKHSNVFSRGEPEKLVRVHKRSVDILRAESLIDVASACADFIDCTLRTPKARSLTEQEARSVLARPDHGTVRRLVGIVRTPRLLRDGRLLATPGYDPESQILYAPDRVWPTMPESPTIDDARAAYKRLSELFVEFDFVDREWATAAAIGGIITLQSRHMFDGAAPLFLLNGSVAGAGKGLLARTILRIGYGSVIGSKQYGSPDEMRKLIYAEVSRGAEALLIDNISRPFGGSAIASATSEPMIGDRTLGKSESADYENKLTIFATGINVQLLGDEMLRRVIDIRQEPKSATPHKRTFKCKLDAYVKAHSAELTCDAITILRAYVLASMPPQVLRPIVGYEGWTETVRAALVWVGAPDLQRPDGEETAVTAEHEAAAAIAAAWVGMLADKRPAGWDDELRATQIKESGDHVAVKPLVRAICDADERLDAAKLTGQQIGQALGKLEGRLLVVSEREGCLRRRAVNGATYWRWQWRDAPPTASAPVTTKRTPPVAPARRALPAALRR